jgi:RNA polymerase sigma factor (sigma-70 family)
MSYPSLLTREVSRYCGPRDDCMSDCGVADQVQEAYLALHDLLRTWKPEKAGFLQYMRHNLRGRLARAFRKSELSLGNRMRTEFPPNCPQTDTTRHAIGRWLTLRRVARALPTLKAPERSLLTDHYFLGKRWAQIARERGIRNVATARKQCSRALSRLRGLLYPSTESISSLSPRRPGPQTDRQTDRQTVAQHTVHQGIDRRPNAVNTYCWSAPDSLSHFVV